MCTFGGGGVSTLSAQHLYLLPRLVLVTDEASQLSMWNFIWMYDGHLHSS